MKTLAEIKGHLGLLAEKCHTAHCLLRQGDTHDAGYILNEIIYGLKEATLAARDLRDQAANKASMDDLAASGGIHAAEGGVA